MNMRMLYLGPAGIILAIALLAHAAAHAADASACYVLTSSDAKQVCLARAHGDPSRCYGVQDSERRAQCFAEVRK